MSSGWLVFLEMLGVLGVVLGLAVWELVRLRGDRKTVTAPAEDASE